MNNRKQIHAYLIPLGAILFFTALWYLASINDFLTNSVFPTTNEFWGGVKELNDRGYLFTDLWVSMKILFPGFILGVFFGAIIGIITGRSLLIYQTIGTYFHIWRALPAVALIPVYIQFFGVTMLSKIVIIGLGVFFPVWINAHEGSSQLPKNLIDLSKSLGLSKSFYFFRLVFPNTLPFIIAGIRSSIAIAYIMLFVSEWIGATSGIGYRMNFAHIINRMDFLFVGLLQLGLLAFITDALFNKLIMWRFPWIRYSLKK